MCICVCVYIYTYIERERREKFIVKNQFTQLWKPDKPKVCKVGQQAGDSGNNCSSSLKTGWWHNSFLLKRSVFAVVRPSSVCVRSFFPTHIMEDAMGWIFVFPKFIYWNSNLYCDGIRRWNLWGLIGSLKVETLWVGIMLGKRTESLLPHSSLSQR